MIAQGIMINWDNSLEFIELDCDEPEGVKATIKTQELWEDGSHYVYKINPMVEKVSENDYVIRIEYERTMNPSLIDKNISWGVSTTYITKGALSGVSEWKDKNDPSQNGKTKWIRVDGPLKGSRRKITATRLQREQAKFRDLLLKLDKRCVLTGEATKAVLEAAHIIPVSEGGTDLIINGFILRSDLHKLYDAGLFRILPTGKIAITAQDISYEYIGMLNSLCLQDTTLTRVGSALCAKG